MIRGGKMSFNSSTVRPPVMLVDVDHYEVHAGNLYTYSITERAVPENNYLQLRIKPTTKSCHVTISIGCEGKSYIKTFKNTAFPLVNAKKTPFNRHMAFGNNSVTEVYTLVTTTGNLLGSLRGDDAVGVGGSAPAQAGGSSSGRLETIVTPSNELLIEVQNVANGSKYINIVINFYEY